MKLHPLAGRHVPQDLLVDVDRLQREYYSREPDFTDSSQQVRAQAIIAKTLAGIMR